MRTLSNHSEDKDSFILYLENRCNSGVLSKDTSPNHLLASEASIVTVLHPHVYPVVPKTGNHSIRPHIKPQSLPEHDEKKATGVRYGFEADRNLIELVPRSFCGQRGGRILSTMFPSPGKNVSNSICNFHKSYLSSNFLHCKKTALKKTPNLYLKWD